MALKPCKECQQEVSTQAKTCPHCGVKAPAQTPGPRIFATLVLLGLIGGCWVLVMTTDPGTTTTTTPRTAPTSPTPPPPVVDLALSVDSCTRRSTYLWTEGSVRNQGEATVNFVQVRLTWQDADGSTVDTGSTYAVGRESLRPGESTTFQGATQHSTARRCVASVLDYRRP